MMARWSMESGPRSGSILERFGIRKIEALGAPFDPMLHEAVMAADDASQAPGTVVAVVEDGYTIRDRLLRPARVVVARRRSNASTASDEAAPRIAGTNREA
jgi:molecular chaperone GrpE